MVWIDYIRFFVDISDDCLCVRCKRRRVDDVYTTCCLLQQLTVQQIKFDECRSPMQWTALKNAGFTAGRMPWRPIAENFLSANVRVGSLSTQPFGLATEC